MIGTYKNKVVLVTGHTGFKGSWLVAILKYLGAKVVGVSVDIPTKISHFLTANINQDITDLRFDIRDQSRLETTIIEVQPDYIFHLAAQPIVGESYIDPVKTWTTNLVGTVNILESLRKLKKDCFSVIITSDKCYDNVEWEWGYRENDALGGKDPYSASKGAAEIAVRSYHQSYFINKDSRVRIASARAGNVIGGGDWAVGRIIPDCVKAWSNGEEVVIKNPDSTRPWQHVLEPLVGYLILGSELSRSHHLNGESFNFGPPAKQNHSVGVLVKKIAKYWPGIRWKTAPKDNIQFYEAGLLKLNCDKALHYLNWEAILDFEETVRLTSTWYKSFYEDPSSIGLTTHSQIEKYFTKLDFNK